MCIAHYSDLNLTSVLTKIARHVPARENPKTLEQTKMENIRTAIIKTAVSLSVAQQWER